MFLDALFDAAAGAYFVPVGYNHWFIANHLCGLAYGNCAAS